MPQQEAVGAAAARAAARAVVAPTDHLTYAAEIFPNDERTE